MLCASQRLTAAGDHDRSPARHGLKAGWGAQAIGGKQINEVIPAPEPVSTTVDREFGREPQRACRMTI